MRRPSRQGMLSLCLRHAQNIDIIATSLSGHFYGILKFPVLILLLYPFASVAQNINYEWVNIKLYRPPLKPLKVDPKTFSVAIIDLGNQLGAESLENIQEQIELPGFSRVVRDASVRIELVLSPLSVTTKELKDKPHTLEKNGVKTIFHQYHYLLNCTFPTKLRVTANGQHHEQDFPAFFQKKYHGRNSGNEAAISDEYERDYGFHQSLFREKLAARIKEVNGLLYTNYGYGPYPEHFSIGYVKDRGAEYTDLSQAMALVRQLLQDANEKKQYLNQTYQRNAQEAIALYESALAESKSDKKARINPKVTAVIHYNLALITFVLQDYKLAAEHLQETGNGSAGTQSVALSLRKKIADYENRMRADENMNEPTGMSVSVEINQGNKLLIPAKADNYIIGKQNDTLHVEFIVPAADDMPFGDSVWIQDQIIIRGDERPVTITPDQILGFCHNGVYHEALWWVDDLTVRPWTTAHKFCKQIMSGAIPVYVYHEVETDDEGYKTVRTNQYYKDDDGYKPVMFLSFKRGVSKLVADYPELSGQVRNGDFTRNDFLRIVRIYNEYKHSNATAAR